MLNYIVINLLYSLFPFSNVLCLQRFQLKLASFLFSLEGELSPMSLTVPEEPDTHCLRFRPSGIPKEGAALLRTLEFQEVSGHF